MRAVVVSQHGGPEVLVTGEVPAPRPGPGEVVIDVVAAGVNFLDVYHRTGYRAKPVPFTPGVEGAGIVSAVGAGVSRIHVGTRVAWALPPGSYAEQIVVPARQVVAIPDGISYETAAAGILHGLSARYLTTETYPVSPGDSILVQGATGGARLLVLQLAKARGARVIATVTSERGARDALESGADEVLELTPRLADDVRRLTGHEGVAAVYDGLGRMSFSASLASLRARGSLVLISELSGPVGPIDPAVLTRNSVKFSRPVLGHHIDTPEKLRAAAQEVFQWILDGTLRIWIGHRYLLDEAPLAHQILETRRDTGKPLILVRPSECELRGGDGGLPERTSQPTAGRSGRSDPA